MLVLLVKYLVHLIQNVSSTGARKSFECEKILKFVTGFRKFVLVYNNL